MFQDAIKKQSKSSEATEADVREDEEQAVKFQEIIDLLVAAGYFRARIRGLSNFDKVVGGMTWCMESCSFDVDVDLLFQENFTIGQKIALTEKIVAVLPKMNCPHRIEPHQIQGLDCIHIFPVVQWLVKQSMKAREEMTEFVRSYAINQFDKNHTLSDETNEVLLDKKKIVLTNIKAVKKSYAPQRKYKRKGDLPIDEVSLIKSTLLEYGNIPTLLSKTSKEQDPNTFNKENELTEQSHHENITDALMKGMSKVDDNSGRLSVSTVGNIVNIQAQEIAKVAESFASLSTSEIQDDNSSNFRATSALEKQRANLQNKLEKLKNEQEILINKLAKVNENLKKTRADRKTVEEAVQKMKEMETNENKGTLLRLKELLSVHDGLKDQEIKFREQCRIDLNRLQEMLAEVETTEPQEEQDRTAEYEQQKEIVNKLRLQLAKKNRAIASLTRQLDDVPGRSELTQYQRRFMELYNQVSAKHKETKQYYTLYNTLDDTKLYLSKELSILNSIQDNYNEAMASNSGKEQFLKQFEAIVDGIKRNKAKAEKRCADEKGRRDALSQKLVTLVEQQRKYVAAVRQLTIECRKNEALLARLRGT